TTVRRSFAERRRGVGLAVTAFAVAVGLACALGACSRREEPTTRANARPAPEPVVSAQEAAPATDVPAPAGSAEAPPNELGAPATADVASGPPAPEGASLAPFDTVSAERLLGE